MSESKTDQTKKLPYYLGKEKKVTEANYRTMINPKLADELYDKIVDLIITQKKYKLSNYSAKEMAKELKTNTRYLSAVINSRFDMTYSRLMNEFRIKDAKNMLVDKRYKDKTVEEIGILVGFITRQSFYASFYRLTGMPPRAYRMKYAEN